jgi:hypothetical protein
MEGMEVAILSRTSTQLNAIIPTFSGNPPVQVYNAPVSPNRNDGGLSNALYFYPKTEVTIKANDATKKYGDQLPELTKTVTINGAPTDLVLPEIVLHTTATDLSNVNFYRIWAQFEVSLTQNCRRIRFCI